MTFCFGKPVLFTLGLGITTRYSLGVLVWNFYQTFVTVSIEFWLRFEPQIRPKRLAINFLLITVNTERKVRLCVKLFDFFSWVITHPFDLKFVAFCLEFSGDSYVEFEEKIILGEIFRNFRVNQGYPLPKHVKFRPTFYNFYFASVLRWKNSHKYFHMLFAPR